ncbi:MAG: peptidylprolyl isomerase [Spirosoma sp.]|nr:peptidylprolyl isomerase [Spirosoma sp.]
MRQFTGGFLLAVSIMACTTTKPVVQQTTPPQPVVLTLGNKAFTTDDFFQSFTKNQLSADSSQHTDVKQYFDLYTNLKLKVVDAEAAGLDTTEAFREELATYRKQLAQSYLTDKTQVESLAAEAYQRMQQEINASHILVAVPDDAAPADTLTAYQTALTLRKRIADGEDFASVARAGSQDATTASDGGSLNWFTAFSLVYPLENAVYNTATRQVTGPVRTRAGYHLLRVNDRRPNRGKLRVAHILIRMSPGAGAPGADAPGTNAAGQQVAKERIDAAYARLLRGELFETVARQVSDDVTSKTNGGQLPAFETGKQVPAFEEAAFALVNPGDISKPVKTNYGWHIIKLLERTPLSSYAELAPNLRQRVTTDTRAEVLRQSALQRLRSVYAVRENKAVVEQAIARADSSLLRGQWQYTEPLSAGLPNQPIITIASQPYSINQFFGYVRQRQQPRRNPAQPTAKPNQAIPGSSPAVAMRRLLDRFIGDQLLATEENDLEKKSPEFRALLAEIHDGILLSQQMEENVWERSMADSTGQRQLFEQNRTLYQFPQRVAATVIVAPTDALLKQVQTVLTGKTPYQLKRAAPDLRYAQNQTGLTPETQEQLRAVLVAMARNPGYVVEVAASHDGTERDSVSAGRIRAVVGLLRQNGVALNRIIERDFQGGSRPGSADPASQRRVSFQYFSIDKADVARAFSTPGQPVEISEGLFAPGTNPYIDQLNAVAPGNTVLHPAGKAVVVLVDRIEPARTRTFAEARGAVINDYQAILERQWLEQLRTKYPVNVNQDEIGKLVK